MTISHSASAAVADAAYPVRPVRLIVPFSPGSSDVTARLVAQKLGETLGQQIVVDNRPGAGSIIGTQLVAKAPADGYTLLFHTCNLAISPALNKQLPYRVPEDFEAIAHIANSPTILVTHPSLPAGSAKELIAYAKANPEALNYGSIGPGSLAYLAAEWFRSTTGIRMTEVSYQGTAPAVTALMASEIQLMFSVLGASLPHVRSGKLKSIAMASAQRSPLLPDVPTVAESGVPGFDAVCWHGVFAPRGATHTITARLNSQIAAAVSTADMRNRFGLLGFEAAPPSNAAGFTKYVSAEVNKWARLIRIAGIQPRE